MTAVKRPFEDCRLCESRGIVCVGDADEADFPCPRCNGWCTGCLEKPFEGRHSPFLGSLFAAVQRIPGGIRLLEGYLCDFHKGRFASYSIIAPGMIGRFAAGEPYIVGSSFVTLYGVGEAANFRELAAEARLAVVTQRCFPDRPWNCYVCPPDLATRVVPPQWARWHLGEVLERSTFLSGARITTWAITNRTTAGQGA